MYSMAGWSASCRKCAHLAHGHVLGIVLTSVEIGHHGVGKEGFDVRYEI